MPDTPFSSIEPRARSTGEAKPEGVDEIEIRRLAAELQLLRHQLQMIQMERDVKVSAPMRPQCKPSVGHVEGTSHAK